MEQRQGDKLMAITRVHVNQHVIRANAKNGENNPVFTIKSRGTNTYAHSVRVTYHVPHDEMSEVIKDCVKLSSYSSIYIDEGNKRKQNI